jgi:hypothetical protein
MKYFTVSGALLLACMWLAIAACSDDTSSPDAEPKPTVYELLATNEQGISIDVAGGQRVHITATDSVNTNPAGTVLDCDLWTDADGITTCNYVWTDPNCRGLPFMALIGTCGADSFLVGTSFDSTFSGDCTLTLVVNDWVFYDNAGRFMVSVLVR